MGSFGAISEVIVGILAPILGAIADFSGSRKKFLGACAMVIVFFTASLYFVGPGMTRWAWRFTSSPMSVSRAAASSSTVFCLAFRPKRTRGESRDANGRWVISAGW